MSNKLTVSSLTGVRVTPKAIIIGAIYNRESEGDGNTVNSTEEVTSRCPEAPLPEFDDALAKLVTTALQFLDLSADYKKGVTVVGFKIKTTKAGTRSISVIFDKKLEMAGESKRFATPFVRIDKAQPGEEDKPVANNAAKTLIGRAIDEAVRYANGERSQSLLNLSAEDEDEEEQDSDQENLNL